MTLSPDFPPSLPEVADQDMELLDIHTHRTPPPADALLSVTLPLPPDATLDRLSDGSPVALGIHPWQTSGFNTPEDASALLAELECLAATPQVIAIGEAGLDPLRGAPLPVQESIFRSQIALSETTGKPLIIHLVRAWDQFLKIRRDTAPRQPWILHGFRGKPRVLEMLLRERHSASISDSSPYGPLYFSVGPRFNPGSLPLIPADRLLIETDDSPAAIGDVLGSVSSTLSIDPADLRRQLVANSRRLFPTPLQ